MLYNGYPFPISPNFGPVTTAPDMPKQKGLLDSINISPQTMGLLGAAAAMLEAGGPSKIPVSLGQAMGRGLIGFTNGHNVGVDMQNDQEKLRIAREKALQELHGGSPYFQFLPTANGYAVGDARKGTITFPGRNGDPALMRGADDPNLQGQIAAAREAAKAPYEFVNTVGPGGEQFSTPKSSIVGGQVPTLPGGSVQTGLSPYKKTAQETSAKTDVERGATSGKQEKQMNQLSNAMDAAENILKDQSNPPTHSGIGAIYDNSAAFFGSSPKGAKEADQLRTISGWLTSNVPRMEGPQSDFDVENYKIMAGNVGDSSIPIDRRIAALRELRALQDKYASINQAYKYGGSPNRPPGATHGGINPATGKMEYFDAQGNKL